MYFLCKENGTRLQWYSFARYKAPGPLVLWPNYSFMPPPRLKGPPGASSNRIVRPFVCLFIRLSVIPPAYKQRAICKVWVVIQLPNLDCKFIYGFRTFLWHPMPLGMGREQNVGLRDVCHISTLLPPGASVFHKHMSSLCINLVPLKYNNIFWDIFHGNDSNVLIFFLLRNDVHRTIYVFQWFYWISITKTCQFG